MRALFFLCLAGCAGTLAIDADDYDRSCSVVEDCVAVYVGDVCGCGCERAAINVDAEDAWREDWELAKDECRQPMPLCSPCQDVAVDCVAGSCGVIDDT